MSPIKVILGLAIMNYYGNFQYSTIGLYAYRTFQHFKIFITVFTEFQLRQPMFKSSSLVLEIMFSIHQNQVVYSLQYFGSSFIQ